MYIQVTVIYGSFTMLIFGMMASVTPARLPLPNIAESPSKGTGMGPKRVGSIRLGTKAPVPGCYGRTAF
jgi:hypothetical protein